MVGRWLFPFGANLAFFQVRAINFREVYCISNFGDLFWSLLPTVTSGGGKAAIPIPACQKSKGPSGWRKRVTEVVVKKNLTPINLQFQPFFGGCLVKRTMMYTWMMFKSQQKIQPTTKKRRDTTKKPPKGGASDSLAAFARYTLDSQPDEVSVSSTRASTSARQLGNHQKWVTSPYIHPGWVEKKTAWELKKTLVFRGYNFLGAIFLGLKTENLHFSWVLGSKAIFWDKLIPPGKWWESLLNGYVSPIWKIRLMTIRVPYYRKTWICLVGDFLRIVPWDSSPSKERTISHTIHVWYIYLHLADFYGKCRYMILWVWGNIFFTDFPSKRQMTEDVINRKYGRCRLKNYIDP